jgi:patatin-like phospholipase/acyl hydrolase
MSLRNILAQHRPRKLLALDGGGIRGLLSIEILARMEVLLREALGKGEDFVLADYFDYVAGTSTGAIIATCVSWGMSVNEIRTFYEKSGANIFDKASVLRRYRYRYQDENLMRLLQDVFGKDTTLETDKLQTLLMIVLRNATTDSPWPVSNNPQAKYNDQARADCNLKLPLWQLVRASTAAPVYFPPELVRVGTTDFIFVDGGITMYNNPAFHLFLMATVEPFNLNWPAGEDNMLVISVGTGTSPDANTELRSTDMHMLYNAASLPAALMFAALNEQDFLCRVFGKCVAGDPLDREVGNLIGKHGPVSPKLFTYARYNAELTRDGLNQLGLPDIEPKNVQALDSIEYLKDLQRIGKAVGQQRVKSEHFAGFFPDGL